MKLVLATRRLWRVFTLPATTRDVGEVLSAAHALEKTENRQCLLKILSNLRFLARQSCAIRGDGDESDSNFVQLFIKLRGEDDPKIHEWMIRRTNKYTSHKVQNDMLKVMVLKVLAACLNDSSFFTIMSDETTDMSNQEQVSTVLRLVDDTDFSVHEEFVGLYLVPSILTCLFPSSKTHCFGLICHCQRPEGNVMMGQVT